MAYDDKGKQQKRRVKLDPLTGISVKKQEREFVRSDVDDYLDKNGHFDLFKFNKENQESCDLLCTTSMAAITAYTRQYFEERVLPEIHTYKVGPAYITCATSVVAGAGEFRERQAAKQSEAGKRNWHNIAAWTDVSSGDVID